MKTYTGLTAIAVAAAVLADGVVDTAEVAALRKYIFADGKVDADEFHLVTVINNAVAKSENAGHDMPGWTALYTDVVAAYVLEDESSPGEVSEAEATELVRAWSGDSTFDARESSAARTIATRATKMPEGFRAFLTGRGISA
ncbi:MAG: hypothetical protein HY455_01535 [Parcubacteria group bacterium]|nr:hypothetical protein [Parcubacteria group bacterium]